MLGAVRIATRLENNTPPRVNTIHNSPPRVNWKELIISDSNNPNSPQIIINTRWNHQIKPRANTPTLLYEEDKTTAQQHNTVTENPYEEKENIHSTPHTIPTDEPIPKTKIKPRRSTRILSTKRPTSISQSAVYHFLGNAIQMNEVLIRPRNLPKQKLIPTVEKAIDLQQVCNGVVHPTTGETTTKYKKIIKEPLLKEVW